MVTDVKNMINRSGPLAENEVKDLMKSYGIKTTKFKIVREENDLGNLGLSFPVALKVCSNEILHKTDVGGVRLGIKDMDELKTVFKDFRVLVLSVERRTYRLDSDFDYV